MDHQTIGLIAGIISLIAYIIYIYKIWWGNTRPSRSSWWMLTVVWGVLFLSSLSLGSDGSQSTTADYYDRAIQISYIVGSLVIAISTIWRGQKEPWKILDTFSVVAVGCALILYFAFSAPLWSLLAAVVADSFAILPTIENARLHPESEDKTAWSIELFASLLSIGTLTVLSFSYSSISLWLPVAYLIVSNGIIVFFLFFGQKKLKTINI